MSSDFHHIDQNRLDWEWVQHPTNYHDYALQLADARKDYELAVSRREVVESEIARSIRRDPQAYGLEKVTEDAVKKTIPIQREYRKADEDVIDAKHTVDVLQAAVTTLDHKRHALENLVKLRLADYFSEPREPKEVNPQQVDRALGRKDTFNRKGKQS